MIMLIKILIQLLWELLSNGKPIIAESRISYGSLSSYRPEPLSEMKEIEALPATLKNQ